jgi:hypothetical protein
MAFAVTYKALTDKQATSAKRDVDTSICRHVDAHGAEPPFCTNFANIRAGGALRPPV